MLIAKLRVLSAKGLIRGWEELRRTRSSACSLCCCTHNPNPYRHPTDTCYLALRSCTLLPPPREGEIEPERGPPQKENMLKRVVLKTLNRGSPKILRLPAMLQMACSARRKKSSASVNLPCSCQAGGSCPVKHLGMGSMLSM